MTKRQFLPLARPSVEALEDRLVMSVTEYAEVARMFPRHVGPTALYLNFDGWRDKGVTAYAGTTNDFNPATDDRERDIQDILFRTSEIFSPFDVQVRRISGNGVHARTGGHTTIFIGDNRELGTGAKNRAGAYVTSGNFDFPGMVNGFRHRPNSHRFDVGFVDPVGAGTNPSRLLHQIPVSIAHEAGHTFGLGHVLSATPAREAEKEVMSYDGGQRFRFVDRSLRLTDENASGDTPEVVPMWGPPISTPFNPYPPNRLRTQNSYQFLEAVLGVRTADDYGNLANAESVQYGRAPQPILGAAGLATASSRLSGTIERYGDYDAFAYTAKRAEVVTVTLQSGAFLGLQAPVLFAYSQAFTTEIPRFTFVPSGRGTTRVTMEFVSGGTLTLVVGGRNGGTVGTYELTVQSQPRGGHGPIGTGPGGVIGRLVQGPGDPAVASAPLVPQSVAEPAARPSPEVQGGNGGNARSVAAPQFAASPPRPARSPDFLTTVLTPDLL